MSPVFWQQLPNALTVLRALLAGGFFAALNAYRYPDENVLWGNIAIGLFIALAIGGVVYLTAFAPQTPFVYWLLLDYWVTLPLIAAVFIHAMRSAAIQDGM